MDVAGRELPLNTVIAAAVLAVIGVLLIVSPRFGPLGQDAGEGPQQGQNLSYLIEDTEPMLGDPDADTVIVYWGDYQCPLCGRFERTTFGDLNETFIMTGEVLFVKKDFPNVAGRKSDLAAQVGECIRRTEDSQTFWDWHTAMYERENFDELSAQRQNLQTYIIGMAERLVDIEPTEITSCLDEQHESLVQEIQEDRQQAEQQGIHATPGFVLYNRETGEMTRIYGARDIETFRSELEEITDGRDG